MTAAKVGGTHGYAPTHPEMLAAFFLAGPGVGRGVDLGEIDMRSVAPTLAAYLGLRLPAKVQVPPKFCGEMLVMCTLRSRPPNLIVCAPIASDVVFATSQRFC